MEDVEDSPEEPSEEPKTARRLIAAGLTVPLVGAAILWWVAGRDMNLARWISMAVVVVALIGWHFSRDRDSDGG